MQDLQPLSSWSSSTSALENATSSKKWGYQGLYVWRLVGDDLDEWEAGDSKGDIGHLKCQVHWLCRCGPLYHAN
jgi:hypothetical protein